MGGSTKGSTPQAGGFNGTGGAAMPSYQSEMYGYNDPYMNWEGKQGMPEYSTVKEFNSDIGFNPNVGFDRNSGDFNFNNNAGGFNPSDFSYTPSSFKVGEDNVGEVTDAIRGEGAHQMGLMNRGTDQAAARSGMSGGSRHGVAQSQGADNINRSMMTDVANANQSAIEAQNSRMQQEASERRQLEAAEAARQQSMQQFEAQQAYQKEQDAYRRKQAEYQKEQDAYQRNTAAEQYDYQRKMAAENDRYNRETAAEQARYDRELDRYDRQILDPSYGLMGGY